MNNNNNNRKIKVKLADYQNDRSKFELLEDARRGDYFFIEDVINDLANIDRNFWERKLGKTIEQYTENIRIKENKKLNQELQNFHQKDLDNLKQIHQKDLEKIEFEVTNKIKENEAKEKIRLNEVITQLKIQLNSEKDKLNFINQNYQKDLNSKISNLKHELEIDYLKKIDIEKNKFQKEKELAINNKLNEQEKKFNQEIFALKNEIKTLEQYKTYNVIQIGQDLEKWVDEQFQKYFGFISIEKKINWFPQKMIADNKRVDFLFECLDDQNNSTLKVVIECKSELSDSKTKTKNSDHFKQIVNYAKKINAEYAVLVSNLEQDNNFSIFLADHSQQTGDKNIKLFVMRREFLMPLLQLMLKIHEIKNKYFSEVSHFSDAEKFAQSFEDWKNQILDRNINRINEHFVKITNNAKKIIELAEEVQEEINNKITKKFRVIENRLRDISPKVKKLVNSMKEINIIDQKANVAKNDYNPIQQPLEKKSISVITSNFNLKPTNIVDTNKIENTNNGSNDKNEANDCDEAIDRICKSDSNNS
ncbi:DUF2130 family protein [[Mycoplasma] cavipharyngis]|uniref:DUF2130 domain-containing protein n=1 Tax=[Mycoplasma] cavipharyngis TaxID=92757 RepID=UPI00370486D0